MYGYGYRYNSGLVIGAGGGAPFANISSLLFDGIDDYVDTGITTTGTNDVTISSWIKTTETFIYTGSRCAFGGIDLTFGGNYTLGRLGSVFPSSTDTVVRIFNTLGTTKLNDGNWHHIAFTYDYTTKEVKAYVNGSLELTVTVAFFRSKRIAIGWNGNSQHFQGNVDECALWYSVLNATEITDIYNNGTPTDLSLLATPPLNWYRNGDNGAWKSPQWLIPNDENKDKVSNYSTQFDGTDDYVDVTLTPSSSDVSVSFWTKAPIQGLGNVFGGGGIFQYFCGTSGVNLLTNHYTVGWVTICTNVFDDQWHHIVVTFDNATSDLISYKDGVLNTTLNIPGFSTVNHGINRIGAYGTGAPQRYFEGIQNDISLFNSVLTQSEVTTIYNGGTPTTISGALAHWKMGDNSTFLTNWTVPDEVGSNDGTSANMTIEDRIGEAPNSTSNALSFNMDEVDRVTDVPT